LPAAQVVHKMSLQQFLSNNRGIDEGRDLPAELLSSLYDSIQAHEIRMEQREFISSEKEGWLLKLPCTFPVPSLYLPCTFPAGGLAPQAGRTRQDVEAEVGPAAAASTGRLGARPTC
jgi:hypothetical protein